MTHYELPYFGLVDVTNREPYSDLEVDLEFGGHPISLDLNFDGSVIDANQLHVVKALLENLADCDVRNKIAIVENYDSDEEGDAKLFAEHHKLECEEDLSEILDLSNPSVTPERQLIDKLRLKRVGFYPYDESAFVIFDYIVDRLKTDYLIAVTRDRLGELSDLAMES